MNNTLVLPTASTQFDRTAEIIALLNDAQRKLDAANFEHHSPHWKLIRKSYRAFGRALIIQKEMAGPNSDYWNRKAKVASL